MKLSNRIIRALGLVAVLYMSVGGSVRAADLSHAVTLVGTARLSGSAFAETVILAAPLPRGEHIGFVLNRPTDVSLASLFPDHASSRNVVEPVYAGGPLLAQTLFAVSRATTHAHAHNLIPLIPEVALAVDAASIDRIIESTPNEARYFVGLVVWPAGRLDDEIRAGAWDVWPASAETVFAPNARDLWKALSPRGGRIMARTGSVQGTYSFAVMADKGMGNSRDPRLAQEMYRGAAQAGYTPAMMRVSDDHVQGHGARRDLVEAYAWLGVAMQIGLPEELQMPALSRIDDLAARLRPKRREEARLRAAHLAAVVRMRGRTNPGAAENVIAVSGSDRTGILAAGQEHSSWSAHSAAGIH